MEDMGEESEGMKADLIRCFRNPLYWLVLSAGLFVRVVLAYFDFQTRSDVFWSLSAEFWNKTGSVTLGFLVLLVLIRLFSADRETGAFPVINSTAYGRIALFLKNQPAAMCICGVPFAFSYFINVAVLKKFEFFWFVRYGFFAEWMRGRRIGVTPGVWGVWYALLLGGLLLAAIHQRKERKEL